MRGIEMDNIDMLKALYDFKAVYPKTISFEEGEHFILYQTSVRQRNWWQVVNVKGNIGFVPSNYVMKVKVEPDFLISFLDSSIESLEKSKALDVNGIISKKSLLERLHVKRNCLRKLFLDDYDLEGQSSISESLKDTLKLDFRYVDKKFNSSPIIELNEPLTRSTVKSNTSTSMPLILNQEQESTTTAADPTSSYPTLNKPTEASTATQENSITSEASETNTTVSEDAPTIYKELNNVMEAADFKATASEFPEGKLIENAQGNNNKININCNESKKGLEENKNYVNDENPLSSESPSSTKLKVESSDVYQIVDIIRHNTNLSFDLSCEALRVVLTSLEQLYSGAINDYLEAVAIHVTDKVETPKQLLGISHDSKRLQYIFSQLADCKNDAQQRTWMLYEDEDDILQFLEELVEILKNADENITSYEISCDQYQSLINLVQYYQMETRWPIKLLLLKTFTAACNIDHIVVDILLTSVLPVEIVEDMKTNFSDMERFKQLIKMLTIIFSLGQSMPVNHQEFLGIHFASFLLEIVEGCNPESLVDITLSLILAFNLQFEDPAQNVVIDAMQNLRTAKQFTEKLLLLLNREEDPTKLLKCSKCPTNAVVKMFTDIFSRPETADLFYTNDSKVLIDIIVRQLSDLCAGNSSRRYYLELCRHILRNTNYQEHQHRKQDLMKIFTRIFCEEDEASVPDQHLVRDIANEFPQLFKA